LDMVADIIDGGGTKLMAKIIVLSAVVLNKVDHFLNGGAHLSGARGVMLIC